MVTGAADKRLALVAFYVVAGRACEPVTVVVFAMFKRSTVITRTAFMIFALVVFNILAVRAMEVKASLVFAMLEWLAVRVGGAFWLWGVNRG